MKANELIECIEENRIAPSDNFEIRAHTNDSKEFEIESTFWDSNILYLAIKPVVNTEQTT